MAQITVTATSPNGSSQSVNETSDSEDLSGNGSTGDSGSLSTSKTEPNKDGGTTTTKQNWPQQGTEKVSTVTIAVELYCPDQKRTIKLTGSGNVSVSGRVDGQCIYVTEVNSSSAGNVKKTVTTEKKKCCTDKDEETGLIFPGSPESDAAVAMSAVTVRLDAESVRGLTVLKRILASSQG